MDAAASARKMVAGRDQTRERFHCAQDERRWFPPSLKLRRTGTKPVEAFGVDGSRTAKSCGPDAPTLASSFAEASAGPTGPNSPPIRGATVAKKPGRRGEHEISRKTIARGKPDETGEPVVPTHVLSTFAHGAAGASDTRLSLRPLSSEGQSSGTTRAHRAARSNTHVFSCLKISNTKAVDRLVYDLTRRSSGSGLSSAA